MSVQEAWQRGNNLVATAIVALAGISFLPEFFLETEVPYKIDDGALFLLGIGAVWWYKVGNHRYVRSIVPVLFVVVSLLIKIMGVVIEFKDKDDVGDDFGGLILFVAATILVLWLYWKNKKEAK